MISPPQKKNEISWQQIWFLEENPSHFKTMPPCNRWTLNFSNFPPYRNLIRLAFGPSLDEKCASLTLLPPWAFSSALKLLHLWAAPKPKEQQPRWTSSVCFPAGWRKSHWKSVTERPKHKKDAVIWRRGFARTNVSPMCFIDKSQMEMTSPANVFV